MTELRIAIERFIYRGAAQPALQEVRLSVVPGRLVGVVGGAGAGKTTLCHAISGFVPHFYHGDLVGSVHLGEAAAADTPQPEWLARVGVVFQNPFTQLTGARFTVREEVAFALENAGVAPDEMGTRVDEVLERLRLSHLSARSPFELSGGQQQLVALASILVMRPQVLVLDEPAAQLDPQTARRLFEILRETADAGTAVIVAEHATDLLAECADLILALDHGRPFAHGTPSDVLTTAIPGVRSPGPTALATYALAYGAWPAASPLPLTVDAAVDGFESVSREFSFPGRELSQPGKENEGGKGHSVAASGGVGSEAVGVDAGEPMHHVEESRGRPRFDVAAVAVEALTYTYDERVQALQGISLRIHAGERVAFVGSNGAGKSTLARHLVGLLRPKAGTVKIHGVDVGGRAGFAARYASYAFQNPDDQLFSPRVEAEVAFGPRNLGLRGAALASRVRHALENVGLQGFEIANPRDLDLPLRKRLALACVLAMDAPVVILDEPTGNLDALEAQRLVEILDLLEARRKTVIVITHDMDFCAEHFPRVVALADGRVIADGSPSAVLMDAETRAAADLLAPATIAVATRLWPHAPPPATRAQFVDRLGAPPVGTNTPKG